MHIYTHTRTHTHIQTYIHTQTRKRTHTHAQSDVQTHIDITKHKWFSNNANCLATCKYFRLIL